MSTLFETTEVVEDWRPMPKRKPDRGDQDDMRLIRLEIARALKRAVRETGISQNALGRGLGITSGTISSWLSGRTQPSLEQFVILCHVLKKSSDLILGTWAFRSSEPPPDDEAVGAGVISGHVAIHMLKRAESTVKNWPHSLVARRRALEETQTALRSQVAGLRRRYRSRPPA